MMRVEFVTLCCPMCDADGDYAGISVRVQGTSRAELEAELTTQECDCALTDAQVQRLEEQAMEEVS